MFHEKFLKWFWKRVHTIFSKKKFLKCLVKPILLIIFALANHKYALQIIMVLGPGG